MQNVDIFNGLVDNIAIKVNTNRAFHPSTWREVGRQVQYDLWIILSGSCMVKMNGEEWVLRGGDMFLFYPNVEYEAYALGGQPCDFLYSHFDFIVEHNTKLLDAYNFAGYLPYNHTYEQEQKMFITLFDSYKRREPLSILLHRSYFMSLLMRVIDYQRKHLLPMDPERYRPVEKLQPAITYMNQHLHEPMAIAQLASLCNLSEKYFIGLFKKAFGITPGRYITQLKMKKALGYLYEHTYSIKEIAAKVGYSDQYTFSKAFKKYYNEPPTRFKLGVGNRGERGD